MRTTGTVMASQKCVPVEIKKGIKMKSIDVLALGTEKEWHLFWIGKHMYAEHFSHGKQA
jgi:hypothetical protein